MNLYDFTVLDKKKNEVSLKDYQGKVVMVVNTATQCGLTPQYEALESMYEKYRDQGFEILDFPSNQFQEQAPESDEEIDTFCNINYKTEFPRFAKLEVNGDNAAPVFQYLKENAGAEIKNDGSADFEAIIKPLNPYFDANDVKWNFSKFLVDKNGNVVARYFPNVEPKEIEGKVEELLK